MRLSVSNIGWGMEQDIMVYELMKKYGYSGLEIAPTRIFPNSPYEEKARAREWKEKLEREYGFVIPSMQSIWFGRKEKLFGTEEERQILGDYSRKAIDFAAAIDCKNLVFGCPGNRNLPENADEDRGRLFFRALGDYALERGTAIGMEANPPIYDTNYINRTCSALELVKNVGSKGFLLNLDVGAMIWNGEETDELKGCGHLISHVHISEPNLAPVRERKLHRDLSRFLRGEGYQGFVSVEMGRVEELSVLEDSLRYIRSVFG